MFPIFETSATALCGTTGNDSSGFEDFEAEHFSVFWMSFWSCSCSWPGEWRLHIDVLKLNLRTYVEGPSEKLVPLNGPKSQVTTSSTTTDSVLGFVHIFLFHPYTWATWAAQGMKIPNGFFPLYTCDRKNQMWISMVNFQNLKNWDVKPYFTIFHHIELGFNHI